jgi:hypothetical protein
MTVSNKLTFGYLYDFRNPAAWHRPWTDLYAETLEFATWTVFDCPCPFRV